MSVQDLIDQRLAEEQALRANRESSNKWRPSLLGSCLRRHWYAKNGEKETNPTDARGLRVFQAGKLFHDFVQAFYIDEQVYVKMAQIIWKESHEAKDPIQYVIHKIKNLNDFRNSIAENVEVKIETDSVKGFADLMQSDGVADVKSQHSRAFFYMDRNVICTIDDGKEVRFNESDIKTKDGYEYVYYYKKERKILKKRTQSILDEKRSNWLQVCWYASELKKQFCRLVFISKDDLCIKEYCIPTATIKPLLDKELSLLYTITSLPDAEPRIYGLIEEGEHRGKPKECYMYCNWLDKCKGERCIPTSTQ